MYQRRSFLKDAALLTSGLVVGANVLQGCKATAGGKNIHENFGLQLYTLRDVLPKDPKGVLRQVAAMGYKEIESYEGDRGFFWGMTATEFKSLMDELGMKIVSSHTDINKDFERKAADAASIGMKYLICPYLGPQKKLDDYKKAAETFNQRGEICKKHGIRFAYHNHDYSFTQQDGQFPQDIMMQNTNADTVDYEMDIYWVVTAGQDPLTWFDKYPGRFKLGHVKDRQAGSPPSLKDASVNLGTGGINFRQILGAGARKGMTHFIVEQEKYENTTPIDAAKADADYMKSFRVS